MRKGLLNVTQKSLALLAALLLAVQMSLPARAASGAVWQEDEPPQTVADATPDALENPAGEPGDEPNNEPADGDSITDPAQGEEPGSAVEPEAVVEPEASAEPEAAAEPAEEAPVLPGAETVATFEALQQAVDAAAASAEGGTVRLGDDITLEGEQTLAVAGPGAVTLKSSGGPFTILRGKENKGMLITVAADATLTLADMVLDGAKDSFSAYDVNVMIKNAGTLNIRSGAVLRNNSANHGGYAGGGAVVNTGTLDMSGGTISGNAVLGRGGGVYNLSSAEMTLSGGTFEDNFGTYGGAIFSSMGSTLTITGGSIVDNRSVQGAVHVDHGYLTMSGGTITGNSAAANGAARGGGVYLSTSNYATIKGGVVTGNSADYGDDFFSIGSLRLSGSPIIGSEAGGLWLAREGISPYSMEGRDLAAAARVYVEGISEAYFGMDTTNRTAMLVRGYSKMDGVFKLLASGLKLTAETGDLYVEKTDNYIATATDLQNRINQAVGKGETVTVELGGTVEPLKTLEVPAGADVKLTGGKLIRGLPFESLFIGPLVRVKGKLTLENVILDGRDGMVYNDGTLVYVEQNATLTVGAGAILRGGDNDNSGEYAPSPYNGGAVCNLGTLTMTGGAITGSATRLAGGGVYNLGAFTMSGGTISGNTAANGGGVYVAGGSFEMSGGTITGNIGSAGGGGVCLAAGSVFVLRGGTVASNSGPAGAEVNLPADGGFTLAPTGKITIGRAGQVGGVYLGGSTPIGLDGTLQNGSLVALEGAAVAAENFVMVQKTSGEISAAQRDMFTLALANWDLAVRKGAEGAGDALALRAVDLQTKINGADPAEPLTLNLDRMERLDGTLLIGDTESGEPRNVVLTGKGLARGSWGGVMVRVPDGSSLTLRDITLDGGYAAPTGSMVDNSGTLTLEAGARLTNNNCGSGDGGAVYNRGAFFLKGGEITGNKARWGGAVYNIADAKMEMTGGVIFGNEATGQEASTLGGGGVHNQGTLTLAGGAIAGNKAPFGGGIGNEGTLTLNGGSLTGNTAGNGGGVLSDGALHIKGGVISGNRADSDGGGVFVGGGAAGMSAGNITRNKAASGGGVYSAAGSLEISGGALDGNTAENHGGGVHVDASGTATLAGGVISRNEAGENGGGLCVNGTLEMRGGSIADNIAECGGGLSNKGTATLSGGALTGNQAKSYGGGAYVDGEGTFRLKGGAITGNASNNHGGGVFSNGTSTLSGGIVGGNRAEKDGGGVYAGGYFTFSGGAISGNTAGSRGGGVCADGEFTLGGGTVGGNRATHGGGVFIGGALTMRGGAISGNTATYGGGVYNFGKSTMKGGTIRGNTATDGGGVYYSRDYFTLENGTITGNTATGSGGGVYSVNQGLSICGGAITGNTAGGAGADASAVGIGYLLFSGGRLGTPGAGGLAGQATITAVPPVGSLLVHEAEAGDIVARPEGAPEYAGSESDTLHMEAVNSAGARLAVDFDNINPGAYTATNLPNDTVTLYLDGTRAGGLQRRLLPAAAPVIPADTALANLDGYTFAGWNTRQNGAGTHYNAGDALPAEAFGPGGVFTLYAQWQPAGNTIAYYMAAGVPYDPGTHQNPTTYAPGVPCVLGPPLLNEVGSEFAGWYLAGDDVEQTLVSAVDPAWRGPIVLMAKWENQSIAPAPLKDAYTGPVDIPLNEGSAYTAFAEWLAAKDTGGNNAVVLYSEQPQVASIAQDGVITAHSGGKASIYIQRVYNRADCIELVVTVTPKNTLAFVGDGVAVAATTLQKGGQGGPWQTGGANVPLGDYLKMFVSGGWQPAGGDVTWKSSKAGVARFNPGTDVLVPVAAGSTVVTAKRGDATATLTVTVTEAMATLTLNKDSLDMQAGKSVTLKATHAPAKAKLAAKVWTVVDQEAAGSGSVVTVDQSGKVTAVGPGRATVLVSATDALGTYREAECAVTVTQAATGVQFAAGGVAAGSGELVLLRMAGNNDGFPFARPTATVLPHTASDRKVDFSPKYAASQLMANVGLLKKTVAYYDTESGNILAGGKDGVASITAKTPNGKKAALKVRVVTPATVVTLNDAEGSPAADFSLDTGKTKQLRATEVGTVVQGALRAPSDSGFIWHSSDPTVATVDKNGKVKAVGFGEANISVRPAGSYYDTSAPALSPGVKVTVSRYTTKVTTIKICQKAFAMQGGARTQLTVSANGGQAILYSGLAWKSSNEGLLTVTENGLVVSQSVSKNTAVTVTANYPGVKNATVKITLTPTAPTAASEVTWKKAAPALLLSGKSYTPSVTVSPSKAGNKNITWSATANTKPNGAGDTIALNSAAWLDTATGKLTGRLSAAYPEAYVTLTGTLHQPGTGPGRVVSAEIRIARGATKVRLESQTNHGAEVKKLALEEGGLTQVIALADSTSPVSFTWKSSSKAVQVAPSADGTSATITGLKGGSATITATVNDGTKKKATVKVTVTQQVRNVVLAGMKTKADESKTEPANRNDGRAVVGSGYYGRTEVGLKKSKTITATLNVGCGKPKNKAVGYEVLAEYDENKQLVPTGSVLSLTNAKKGTVKGLATGYALVRVYSAECPASDFEVTVNPGTANEELARNVCLVQVVS